MVPPLEALGVRRSWGRHLAVDDLDLAVAAGEVVAVVGLNGAGKTTLMRLLLGMVAPDAGQTRIRGVDVRDATATAWADVGHMVDAACAWPQLTVRQNLEAAARLHGVPSSMRAGAVDDAIERLVLGEWADRPMARLSSGNRQRLGLACALVHRPGVIVLDEPSSALDPAGVVAVRRLLRAEAGRGAAILVSSHHLDEIASVADRILVLHRGRWVGHLDPAGDDLERRFFDLVRVADGVERAVDA